MIDLPVRGSAPSLRSVPAELIEPSSLPVLRVPDETPIVVAGTVTDRG